MLEHRVQFLKCLGDDTRLSIALLLNAADELCVCDLVENLGVSQPLASRHLAQLRQCGIVSARRDGKWMHYRLSDDLQDWQRELIETLAGAGGVPSPRAIHRAACAA